MAPTRSRSISWGDPHRAFSEALGLPGLEFLQKIIDGEIDQPPIGDLMDMKLVEVSHGRAVFVVTPAEFHYNPIGSVHGGLAATVCDAAMACAIQSTLPAGKLYTTIELKINYLRPLLLKTGQVRAVGDIIHISRRIATAEARVLDRDERLYAHATATCLAMDLPKVPNP